MDIYYQLTKYQANISEIDVFNNEDEIIGTLQRFSRNPVSESIGRHLSSTFVSSVRARDLNSNDVYTLQLKNQLKAFVSTAEWTIEKNDQFVGSIKEQNIGRTLIVELPNEQLKVTSPIPSVREIKFLQIAQGREIPIGTGKRNLSIANPQIRIIINEGDAPISPMLFAALSFAHHNQGK